MASRKVIPTHNAIVKTYTGGRQIVLLSKQPFKTGKRPPGVKTGEPGDEEEILERSLSRTRQKVHDLAFSNDWDLFVTVTFDPKKVSRFDYDDVVEKYSNKLRNIKLRKAPGLEYLFLPEPHKNGAFHFHGLLRGIDGITLKDSRKRTEHGDVIYNLPDFDLGFNTATKVKDTHQVTGYILKYITKDMVHTFKGRKRYWSTKGLDKTQVDTYLLREQEQWKLVEMLSKNKETVSAKTVSVDKHGYTNELTYIVLQNERVCIDGEWYYRTEESG